MYQENSLSSSPFRWISFRKNTEAKSETTAKNKLINAWTKQVHTATNTVVFRLFCFCSGTSCKIISIYCMHLMHITNFYTILPSFRIDCYKCTHSQKKTTANLAYLWVSTADKFDVHICDACLGCFESIEQVMSQLSKNDDK